MILYEISNGYLGEVIDTAVTAQDPTKQYTRNAPPVLSSGEYAFWVGKWTKTLIPPMPPEPEYDKSTQRIVWTGQTWMVYELDKEAEGDK